MSQSYPESELSNFLKRNEQGFSALAACFNQAIVVAENGLIWFANSKFLEMTGFTFEEIAGKRIHEIFFTPGSPESAAEEKRIAELYKIRMTGVSQSYETHIIRKDGKRRWVETNAAPLRDENNKIIGSVGTITDITENKILEEQVRWSQKMDAVSKLAGSVAHDFNNLLTVIHGYARELKLGVAENPELLKQTDIIIKASETASALTKQMLTISQRRTTRFLPISLSEIVSEFLPIIEGLAGKSINITTSLADVPAMIRADSSHLQQILINLVVNARDAMSGKGELIISTSPVDDTNNEIVGQETSTPKFIRLRVKDNGCGIPEEIRDKIFEPFFTTKKGRLQGSGLGLHIVFGIVKEHKGEILLNSNLGEGTSFDILFPIATLNDERFQSRDGVVHSPEGSETIFLVEDEDLIRELFKKYLGRLGYQVYDFVNGHEALLHLKDIEKVDLLITDVIMPKVGGIELAEKILAGQPDLKVIVISGFPDEQDGLNRLISLGYEFLEKPLTPYSLAQQVRRVLDGKPRTNQVG